MKLKFPKKGDDWSDNYTSHGTFTHISRSYINTYFKWGQGYSCEGFFPTVLWFENLLKNNLIIKTTL